MERNYKVETAICPKCGALCINGHDDDGHIYCAKCKQTFVPQELTQISLEEFKALNQKVAGGLGVRYECSGWTAYVVD